MKACSNFKCQGSKYQYKGGKFVANVLSKVIRFSKLQGVKVVRADCKSFIPGKCRGRVCLKGNTYWPMANGPSEKKEVPIS